MLPGETLSLELSLCHPALGQLPPARMLGPERHCRANKSLWEHFIPGLVMAVLAAGALMLPSWILPFSPGMSVLGRCLLRKTGALLLLPCSALLGEPRSSWDAQPGEQRGQRWCSLSLPSGFFSMRCGNDRFFPPVLFGDLNRKCKGKFLTNKTLKTRA